MPSSPQSSVPSDAPCVILAAWPGVPPLRELLLALAARGQTILLWLAPGAPAADDGAVLELQLELARAGGIVLAHEGASLKTAAETLGRIDLALARDEGEAGAIAHAAAQLERDRRPGRILLLRPRGSMDEPSAASCRGQSEMAAGVRIHELDLRDDAPGETVRRIMDWCAARVTP